MRHLDSQMQYFACREQVLQQREELLRRELANQSLHAALQSQRLSFASSLSMISQFFREVGVGPFDLPTRLGKNPVQRYTTLLKMKRDHMQLARDFMTQRHHFTVTAAFCDQKKFEASNGDLCSTRFESTPLPGARSIKSIVDALQNFVFNIEISISEVLGDITVRENDDASPDSPVAQHRLVTTIADVVQLDTNNVAFAEYRPAGPPESGESEVGLLICDAVDEDELFPYRPSERVRQDLTAILMVAWHQHENDEPVLVVTRWWCLRIRKSELFTPPFVIDRVQTGIEKVNAAMLTAARHADRLPVRRPEQSGSSL
ncbi:hypothetical protein BBJ28_00010197 [Nothophytophthora sp. Chile5]|nr:hypothetical protein BBJ28_00010197 [Nothophytophthora sp. Chile5]